VVEPECVAPLDIHEMRSPVLQQRLLSVGGKADGSIISSIDPCPLSLFSGRVVGSGTERVQGSRNVHESERSYLVGCLPQSIARTTTTRRIILEVLKSEVLVDLHCVNGLPAISDDEHQPAETKNEEDNNKPDEDELDEDGNRGRRRQVTTKTSEV
jgi:hypothetical protein